MDGVRAEKGSNQSSITNLSMLMIFFFLCGSHSSWVLVRVTLTA